MTVQSHLKMFELCATTRVMCLRHPTPVVHVWDVARRSRFSACDLCSELPCVVLCRSTVIFSDKQNWWKAPRLVTPTRQKHQTDSLPLPFRPRPRYRRRQGLRGVLGHRDRRVSRPLFPGCWCLPHPGTGPDTQVCLAVLVAEPLHVPACLTKRSRLCRLRHGCA